MANDTTMEIKSQLKDLIEANMSTTVFKVFMSNSMEIDKIPSLRFPCINIRTLGSEADQQNNEMETTEFELKILNKRERDPAGEVVAASLESLANALKVLIKRKFATPYGACLRYTTAAAVEFIEGLGFEVQGVDIVISVKHQEIA